MDLEPRPRRIGNTELAVVEQGAGDLVVLVHGSVNDLRSWGQQLPAFGERYRTVAYSRRYHWPNTPPSDGDRFTIDQHVADLAALVESLGAGPAHVVGSSFGAMTSLALGVARPDLVRTLVLGEPPLLPWLRATPHASLVDDFYAQAFVPAGEALARGETEVGIRTFIDGVIGPGAFDGMPEPVRTMMLANAEVERLETAAPAEEYFPQVSPELVAELDRPVLLVEGERSPQMFGRITDVLEAHLRQVERVVIPAASHGMHAQNPGAYNDAVLAFLVEH